MPARSRRRACSATALNTAGSPEQSRTTSSPAASASTMAAMISSSVRSAVSTSRAPGGQWARTSAGTRLPAYRHTEHCDSRRWARTVIRSAAPGPAPTKWMVTGAPDSGLTGDLGLTDPGLTGDLGLTDPGLTGDSGPTDSGPTDSGLTDSG